MVEENDTVYIASAFPSDLDYKNKRRLSPIIKLNGEGKVYYHLQLLEEKVL